MNTRSLLAFVLLLMPVSGVAAPGEMGSESDIRAFVTGNTAFAFDLYARLKDLQDVRVAGGNLFFSPYSISTALAMTACGARGETLTQMTSVLHFPAEATAMGADSAAKEDASAVMAFGQLQNRLQAEAEQGGCQLHIANALWGQKGYYFLESFLLQTKVAYGAGFNEVDFRQTEQARQIINAWVEKQTRDRIKDLIPRRVLDPLTTLVLTNAIYFKGDWAVQFKEENTSLADFFLAPAAAGAEPNQVQVPMMYQKGTFAYAESEEAQILSLPYKGKGLSMVVFLPKADSSLASFESGLDAERLESDLARLREREVEVYLPKFKMTCGTLALGKTLIAMGMKNAFDPDVADFSGMDGTRRLFIGAVLHKAFVEVNEEGTEAAAATAVIMVRSAAQMNPVFRADRPFLFLIRENQTGSILFMGRMMDPGSA